ncbi:hypothetical protein CL644_00225 [bacterium]|nr:hypothetical protein [Parcubacteria group bacterium]MBF05125.1 hypothetical protein [bacterium]|tara:strand:+ start:14010 stop:14360 length:351 start_codon:yes stop_codon:yes gene_type:complete
MFKSKEPVPINPWAGAEGSYVYGFRNELRMMAENLTRQFRVKIKDPYSIQVRYAPWSKKAELFIGDEVLARVSVEGEVSTPSIMIVETYIAEQYHKIFTDAVYLRVRFMPMLRLGE